MQPLRLGGASTVFRNALQEEHSILPVSRHGKELSLSIRKDFAVQIARSESAGFFPIAGGISFILKLTTARICSLAESADIPQASAFDQSHSP